jgi:signal transduction histidine kinase
MKDVKFESKIVSGILFVLTLISIILTSYYSYEVYQSFNRSTLLQEKRAQSIELADELRQSSDDLTNFARMYAVTGDKKYKFIYNRIISIRDGTEIRPPEYQDINWDLNVLNQDGINLFTVVVDENGNEIGRKVSFEKLMREVGMDADEFKHLDISKSQSDYLAQIEMDVFRIIEADSDSVTKLEATHRLFDSNYLKLKATIMKPIKEFHHHVDERTKQELNDEIARSNRYVLIVISLSVATLILVSLLRFAIYLGRKKNNVLMESLNRKNAYLEHAAKIIRHDMHSGINTYIPRGLSSLERRVDQLLGTDSKIKEQLFTSMRLIKEGLSHTQKVYIGAREFTDLVKKDAVLRREELDITHILNEFLKSTSYKSQVEISDIGKFYVNESLFCTAIDNLIRNGLLYNDSEIKMVKIYRIGNELRIEDNGRGMTSDEFREFSKPYVRKNDNQESGSGLGLNICTSIMKEHGFEVCCTKIKNGTRLSIILKNT